MTMAEIDGLREIADEATERLRRVVAEVEHCERCGGDGLTIAGRQRITAAVLQKESAEREVIFALRAYWAQQEDDRHGQQT